MAITVNYQPSFETVGRAAFDVGRGRYNQQQDEIARQQAQLNIENQFRQAQLMQQDRRMNYGMYADQQNRMDRRNELQFSREAQLDDRNFRVAMDDRNFDQRKQLQQNEFNQAENMLDLRAKMEAEAEEAERLRRQKAMEDAITMDHTPEDKLKIQQLEQLQRQVNGDARYGAAERAAIIAAKQAQLGIGEKVPVNQELLKDLNARTVMGENGTRLIRKANGDFDLHPEDKFKLENQKEEIKAAKEAEKIVIDQKKAEQQVFATAQRDYQRDTNSYITDRNQFIEKQVNDAMEQRRRALSAKDEEGNLIDPKSVPEVNPAEIRAQAEAMYDKFRDKPKYIDYFPFAEQAGGAAMNEALAPTRSGSSQPQLPQPQQQAPPPPVPQPPVLAEPPQERQFVIPDNHPAAPQYKAARTLFQPLLGKGDVVNEDALAQDFQVEHVKGGTKAVEQLKTELSRASQLISAVDEGGRKLTTPQELEEFRLASRLLMKYIASTPRNQR